MSDPITRLGMQRIIKLSADLEVDLATRHGGNIAIEILRRLRERAAESLTALAFATETLEIIRLQNEIKRYDEWVVWLREIIHEGKAYDQRMTEEDRAELLDVLTQSPEGQREAVELGLIDEELRDA